MEHTPEQFTPTPESLRALSPLKYAEREITLARVDALLDTRERMLASIARDIDSPLYQALWAKIKYEHASLLEHAASDAQEIEQYKRQNVTLKSEYFVRKPFNIELI